jgi:hypothetical protein
MRIAEIALAARNHSQSCDWAEMALRGVPVLDSALIEPSALGSLYLTCSFRHRYHDRGCSPRFFSVGL